MTPIRRHYISQHIPDVFLEGNGNGITKPFPLNITTYFTADSFPMLNDDSEQLRKSGQLMGGGGGFFNWPNTSTVEALRQR